ncbi:unnamed protein product [Paramecium pentaurelia]|uniref:Uncharacterized protein n=1 Tax=Paramecium pentaurelia TaxID=43138 RepID=A0A8S1WZ11_9CILI|nr:unnamed protein product [Paramecium pentaurelia]
MQQYREFKSHIRKSEYTTSDKNFPLALHALLIYVFFISFNIAGKMCQQDIFAQRFPGDKNNLGNLMWFCYQTVAFIGLAQLPKIINFITFRIILMVGSLGPQIFILPAILASSSNCPDWAIYLIGIVCSIFSGILSVIFLFGMLYYLSNLSFGDEKILYYCSLYFIHSFQWILGSFFAEIFSRATIEAIGRLFYISIVQLVLSLLFLTTFEPNHPRLRRTKEQILSLIEIKTSQQVDKVNTLRQLIMSGIQVDSLNQQQKAKSEEELKQIMNNMTIQCFSLDSSNLSMIIEKEEFNVYQNKSYLECIKYTSLELWKRNALYLLPLVLTVALLEGFIYIQMLNYIMFLAQKEDGSSSFEIEFIFFYVGLGYVLGCFAIGIFGDFKDKIVWMIFTLTILQFSFIFSWVVISYRTNIYFFFQLFAAMLGFCASGLTSSIVSFLCFEFSSLIYMVDTIYIIYSLCFAISSLLFIFGNRDVFEHLIVNLSIIQLVALSNYYFIYKYYRIKKLSKQ